MSDLLQSVPNKVNQRRHIRRTNAARVLRLARKLPAPERLLIEQVYRHGLPVAEVARLTAKPTRSLQRRVANLIQRIRQPLYQFVASRGELLPREVRSTAKYSVLAGLSLRQTSIMTGLSLHRVRQHMNVIEILSRG